MSEQGPAKQMSGMHLAALTAIVVVGSSSLVTFSAIALFGTAVVGITQQPAACILPFIWAVPWAAEIAKEIRTVLRGDRAKQSYDLRADGSTVVLVVAGAVTTFWISTTLGRGPIVASAVVCALSSALMKSPAVPLGSYVGMSSAQVFHYWTIMGAGAIAGATLVATKHAFNGFGGKIGTCAWVGSIVASQIAGQSLLTRAIVPWSKGWLLVLYCGVAASSTTA